MNRTMISEYMNRQLAWNEFSELLLLLLSLLNSSSVKNFLRPFSSDKSSDSSIDDILCAICQGKPTITFLAIPSQHRVLCCSVFCCSQCGESINTMQRHGGSVNNISQIQILLKVEMK